jgi:hypothetical protein
LTPGWLSLARLRGHLDAATVAGFREGLLAGRRAARAAAHLARCSRCAGLDARLASVSALLAATPAPPVPPGLTARIEAALAAEAARAQCPERAASPAGGRAGTAAGARGAALGRPGRATPARPPRVVARLAVAGAAAVALAAGGYGVYRIAAPAAPAAAPSAARPAALSPAQSSSRPGLPSAGGLFQPAVPGLPVIRSGTDYRPGRLGAQVLAVLTQYGRGTALGGAAPALQPSGTQITPGRPRTAGGAAAGILPAPFGTASGLRGCVRRVTGGLAPRLVDLASYRGRPAVIIAAPVPGGSGIRVWAVAAGCTGRSARVLARALAVG